MADVLITEFLSDNAVAELRSFYDVDYDPGLVDDRARLLESAAPARALVVRNRTVVDAELLDRARSLKVVARLGVGVDNIDLAECDSRNIRVSTGAGLNTVAVAEYVVTVMLWLIRGLDGATPRVVAGEWPRRAFIGSEISKKRLGLIGFGEIARAVASRAIALGMKVSAHDPYVPDSQPDWEHVTKCSFQEVLEASDVVSVHVPRNPETEGLVDESRIDVMRPGAILVNTSRGGVVDEKAVVAALRRGQLGGAALDVFDEEPVSAHNGAEFDSISNLILTPHVAGVTVESEDRIASATIESIHRFLGSPE